MLGKQALRGRHPTCADRECSDERTPRALERSPAAAQRPTGADALWTPGHRSQADADLPLVRIRRNRPGLALTRPECSVLSELFAYVDREGPKGGEIAAMQPIWLGARAERRHSSDRRAVDRGGRRLSDRWYAPNPPCDGCGSSTGLQWVCGSDDFDQYHCRECGYRVFAAR
jgi:hypothetical protein